MSLTTTGMSAAAIACAISPPIVPPPTTAALLTNIRLGSSLNSLILAALGCAAGGHTTWEAIRIAGATTSDRDELCAFELALDQQVDDEVRRERWGRLFLTPSLPLIWDASWVGIEQVGLRVEEVIAIADEALGGAGFAHR